MFPYRGIMLHKIYFPVLCAQKLRMTLINEDKERHYQNSLKRLVSYDTNRTRRANSSCCGSFPFRSISLHCCGGMKWNDSAQQRLLIRWSSKFHSDVCVIGRKVKRKCCSLHFVNVEYGCVLGVFPWNPDRTSWRRRFLCWGVCFTEVLVEVRNERLLTCDKKPLKSELSGLMCLSLFDSDR